MLARIYSCNPRGGAVDIEHHPNSDASEGFIPGSVLYMKTNYPNTNIQEERELTRVSGVSSGLLVVVSVEVR